MRQLVQHALAAGLSGLIFSALLSAVIVTGIYARVAPFTWIERMGIDASFRLLASFPDDDALQVRQGESRFLFLDVDAEACRVGDPGQSCAQRNPIREATILRVVDYLLNQPVRAILVDSEFDLANPGTRELVDMLVQRTSSVERNRWPVILLPMEVRPENGAATGPEKGGDAPAPVFQAVNQEWFDPEFRAGLLRSAVRPAPTVLISDAEAGDGKVRRVPRFVTIGSQQGYQALPNMPLMLSEIARGAGLQDIDCRYYGCGSAPQSLRFGSRDAMAQHEAPAQVKFLLPSLALEYDPACTRHDAGAEREAACRSQVQRRLRYAAIYTHEPLSPLLADGEFGYDQEALRDTIAILGTSLPSGQDLHDTPLGAMSGTEILINSTRTFEAGTDALSHQSTSPARAVGAWIEKVVSALPAAVVIVVAYLLAGVANALLERRYPSWRNRGRAASLITTAIVSIALVVCVIWETRELGEALYRGARQGEVIDTLTPIVALLFERYAELTKTAIEMIEHASAKLVGWSVSGILAIRTLIGRPG